MNTERLEEIRGYIAEGDMDAYTMDVAAELLAEVDRLNGLVSDSFRIIEALHRKINQETA